MVWFLSSIAHLHLSRRAPKFTAAFLAFEIRTPLLLSGPRLVGNLPFGFGAIALAYDEWVLRLVSIGKQQWGTYIIFNAHDRGDLPADIRIA